MLLYALNMPKKICKYINCISQICKKCARNMPDICLNMQVICRYMLKICRYSQSCARNMQEICKYIDCIRQICKKYAVKICRNMQFICNICRSLNIAYFSFICTPHFADGRSGRLWRILLCRVKNSGIPSALAG